MNFCQIARPPNPFPDPQPPSQSSGWHGIAGRQCKLQMGHRIDRLDVVRHPLEGRNRRHDQRHYSQRKHPQTQISQALHKRFDNPIRPTFTAPCPLETWLVVKKIPVPAYARTGKLIEMLDFRLAEYPSPVPARALSVPVPQPWPHPPPESPPVVLHSPSLLAPEFRQPECVSLRPLLHLRKLP